MLLIFTTGCTLINEPSDSIKEFVIQSEHVLPVKVRNERVTVHVVSDIPTDRPYIKMNTRVMKSIAGAQWHESLPIMIEKTIAQNLQDAGFATYRNLSAQGDIYMKITIRHFGLECYEKTKHHTGKKIHAAYFVEVYDKPRGRLAKSQLFEVFEDYEWVNDEKYIESLNMRHEILVKRIYDWVFEE
ncbi:MAG: hypothetical protein H6850_02650 [Alphaproteobacteria bacterium]|nr:MAG: hypothetical protein H6850_02650 [Alphaproteobacteria bacterium]